MSTPTAPLRSVLVANRGEIVVRVCRTLARRGIRSIAVHTPDDAGALHVQRADVALDVDSYLDAGALVGAALASGAQAVHPGYGFLSEDPSFARAVIAAGLVWIGPPPEAIESMGDKIRAKQTVAAAGVPVVPGVGRPGMTDEELAVAAREIGLPVLLKPSAGGGGKGMRRVEDAGDLPGAIAAARREAQGAFGDDTLLAERWISRPRHIEMQVFADRFGTVVHLGERECSLQRRHQKIVEESPSPLLGDATRTAMAQSAMDAARACGYVGAGTVEFIVSADRPDEYFFMEMNTRLQVEHPVTEAVTGVDLVEWQLMVAAGERIPLAQHEIRTSGHAVEARIYAEDPRRGFLPSGGTVRALREPAGSGIRVDSSLFEGAIVGTRYDPMLSKVTAWGETRAVGLSRLAAALAATSVLGVTTNVSYLSRLVAHPDVVAGRLDTELVERTLGELCRPDPSQDAAAAITAACALAASLEPEGPTVDPWALPDGWTPGGPRTWVLHLRRDGEPVRVHVRGRLGEGATVRVDDGDEVLVMARPIGDRSLLVSVDGTSTLWVVARAGEDLWVGRDGAAWHVAPDPAARAGGAPGAERTGPVTSPMPGVVVAVHVEPGARVRAGQALVAVEAMKMEHSVVARSDGIVTSVHVRVGQAVGLDEALVEVDAGAGVVTEAETDTGGGPP